MSDEKKKLHDRELFFKVTPEADPSLLPAGTLRIEDFILPDYIRRDDQHDYMTPPSFSIGEELTLTPAVRRALGALNGAEDEPPASEMRDVHTRIETSDGSVIETHEDRREVRHDEIDRERRNR